MTTQVKITSKGFEDYLERLNQLGADLDEAAARAVLAGAEVAQEGMIARAPELTGNLKRHIRIKGPDRDGNYVFCEVGVIHEKGFTDAETARYANAQEYGTSSMAAHPYIRPTMYEDRRKIIAAMRESFERDLER